VDHDVGSILATGGTAIVNVSAALEDSADDDAHVDPVVEGGLLDRLMPRTGEDWFKLAVGAVVGFLLGRRLK